MDDSLQELENELTNLRPRAVSRALHARVEADLAGNTGRAPIAAPAAPARPKASLWFNWLVAAAAIAVVGAAAWWRLGTDSPAPRAVRASAEPRVQAPAAPEQAVPAGHYRPVEATSVLYDLKDDGDVYLGEDTLARRVRYRYVDTYTWRNPATHASLKWSVPREEVRVLPASLH